MKHPPIRDYTFTCSDGKVFGILQNANRHQADLELTALFIKHLGDVAISADVIAFVKQNWCEIKELVEDIQEEEED